MHSAEKFDVGTLNWVKGEIDETLKQARVALEAYAENDDENQLQYCIAFLHQVGGTLQMVELQGASTFAKEIEQLAAALHTGDVADRNSAIEVLMRAILQLPDYLESLQAGGNDNPAALRALFNELRIARGDKPLDASELFSPDLSVLPPAKSNSGIDSQALARKIRPYYQAALLKLLRDDDSTAQLKILSAVSDKLYAGLAHEETRRWIWILRGFLESLREGGLPTGAQQKQLLGKCDQILKGIAEAGEEMVKGQQLAELNRCLLFQVSISSSNGALINELRARFKLDAQNQSQQPEQELLGGFNSELKRTVANDVLTELGRIKDSFDIFVRSDRKDCSGLSGTADNLTTVADTLVLLRQDELAQMLRGQADVLRQLSDGKASSDDTTLMGVAGAIIYVESALGDWGDDSQVEQADDVTGQIASSEAGQQVEAEHRRVVRQVMKEARDGVIRIREAISQYLDSPGDRKLLSAVPAQLHEIVGSLTMLSYLRAAQVLRACGLFINRDLVGGQTAPSAEKLDALADAIMSIEYYLEAFVQSRVHPGSVLEVAESGVEVLGYPVDRLPDGDTPLELTRNDDDDELSDVSLPASSDIDSAVISLVSPDKADASEEVISLDVAPRQTAVTRSVPPPVAPISKPAISEVDDEIIEIFIEEATEELQNIGRLLPMWSGDPSNEEALRDLRRSFHTLKGSGRLVGAAALGEFAWAFENMLNRVIDATIRPGPALFDMLDQAQSALAVLLENFKSGASLDDDIEMLRQSAHEMAQPGGMKLGVPAPTVAVAEKKEPILTTQNASAVPATIIQQLDMDPVLLEIYEKESEGHLEELETFIDNYAKGSHRATEPLIRALHTLTGSSRMAGVMPVAQVTTLLEKYSKTVQVERIPMSQDAVSLLKDTAEFIRRVLAHMQDSAANALPENSELVIRATALYETVQHAEESVAARPEEGLASVQEPSIPDSSAIEVSFDLTNDAAATTTQDVIELSALEPLVSSFISDEKVEEPEASPNDLERALEILNDSAVNNDAQFIAPIDIEEVEPESFSLPSGTTQAVIEDYDPELLDIFLEEGHDILNESEETLHAWVKTPNDRSLVEALQRQLHTLKGGARMAGLKAIGDLGHSLESTFEAVVEGRLERSKRMMDLLQLSHDRLVVMLEQVRNHQPLTTGDDLIAQIYSLGKERVQVEPLVIEKPAQPIVPVASEELPAVEQTRITVHETVVGLSEAIDPLETLLANGGVRISKIADNAIIWRRAPDDMPLMLEIRAQAESLMNEAGTAVIVEITELAKAIVDLLRAVEDGHVPAADKMFNLLDAAGERLKLIFGQLVQKTALSNGLYLVGSINEVIKSAIAEQRASVGVPVEEPIVIPAKQADVEAETEDNRRRGARVQHELVRVRADLLDNMVNFAGEVSIYRSRVEQQLGAIRFNIEDLDQTVARLREQVRQFDIETEAQIDSRYKEAVGQEYEDFDPLEFDRFTHMQQLSRSMMESLNDLMSIEEMMLNLSRESETLLLQQSRVNTELQETLMHTRMVPLVEHAPRLRRIVRQTCAELKKEASLIFKGAEVEMDRNVVDRILAPMEHMLRNSVAHGIETPEKRISLGKSAEGTITVALAREGSEIVIRVSDDGGGINLDAVRKKAVDKGLMAEGAKLSDREVMHFILESGFSTAETLSQIAGRGVGMDVVASEIKQLGGVLDIDSVRGKGTLFTIRLPLTLSVSRALLVYAGEDIYAIPLLSITGIERIAKKDLDELLATENPQYRWVGQDYELMHLSRILAVTTQAPPQEGDKISILLAQSGDNRIALAVDGLVGNREIVVKSLGAQLSTLQDISGATILADGHVALIIDLPALIRRGLAKRTTGALHLEEAAVIEEIPTVMVVDDSITVRKVTERLLKRHNMKCVTAKDGLDALTVLEDVSPDVMLLDIEMPRMDGYELATHLRSSQQFRDLPIIMITSRTGEKHRQRAMDIGVNIYMGKPYTEADLLASIESLLKRRTSAIH